MCFDLDSQPPIAPIEGGALDSGRLSLTAADGTVFDAFLARAAQPTGAGMLVLPDVRGLHHYYEELVLRFAEAGIDSLAIDYFARTAPSSARDESFDYQPHVGQTTYPTLAADIAAGAKELRASGRVRSLFSVGFCFGGRLAFLTSAQDLHLAGAIGFYGSPTGPARNGSPAPVEVAGQMHAPILGLFGGADQGIPQEARDEFDRALTAAGVEHELLAYPGAPHSFFDRKAADFADASTDAWRQVLAFVAGHTAAQA